MRARILAIQHEWDAPTAWLGGWWAEAGCTVDVVRGDLGEPLPERVEHDALVVLGGEMGANDDAEHPWLAPTKALVRDAVDRSVPVLGVCLGHQLASVALGGRVERNPHGRTVGVVPVRLTPAGEDDPLLRGLGGRLAVHYNDDVVTRLSPGAVVLARLPDGMPQAVRLGELAWGVQFHPETPPEDFEDWIRTYTPPPLGDRERAVIAAVAAARDELRTAWRPFARRFADLAARARSSRPSPSSRPPGGNAAPA